MRVATAIAATLFFAALPVVALGHADLVSSDPPVGGTLTTTPYTLTATYDDELQATGSSIVVQTMDGQEVARGGANADGTHDMTVELPAMSDGQYKVLWTAVSLDDQAVERGQYTFNVSAAAASATPAATAPPDGGAAGSSNDVLIALGLAAVLIVVVVGFVVIRGRR